MAFREPILSSLTITTFGPMMASRGLASLALVELRGIEPLTSAVRLQRSTI